MVFQPMQLLLAPMKHRAAVNEAAVSTLKVVYPITFGALAAFLLSLTA